MRIDIRNHRILAKAPSEKAVPLLLYSTVHLAEDNVISIPSEMIIS
jgi:hypothetical protein